MRKLVFAAGLAAMAASPVLAQDIEEGAVLYERHCATCHGIDAEGAGPMAGVLLIQPVDLTTLVAANDGEFPLLRVVRRIDGRDPLISHGSPMPVYGDFFEGDDTAMKTASGQPLMTSRAIADLVAYLESLQAPAE
ncbi:c-type cytochrome [Marimonas arenosa]|uniref:Cytochrome c n=1 Tax=Marimonas arenosa TaxID=1795305 RepID=A0AAE3WH33_9RHOB|nr:cytochrome c [Marimonas arenosa]MDQ2091585.1 cytochrome c [Marimonas arenosa]